MAKHQKPHYVSRVNQLDALYLNEEIYQRIKQPFLDSLQALGLNYNYYYRFQPEVELLLDSIMWHSSMCRKQPATFGQQILMMAYNKKPLTQMRLAIHYCLTILSRYLKNLDEKRFNFRIEWLSKCIEITENTLQILNIVIFFRFLKSGFWPSFVDYILGLDYVTIQSNHSDRNIGSQYLARELLWDASTELLTTLMPIVDLMQMNRFFKNILQIYWQRPKDSNLKNKLTKSDFCIKSRCVYCDQRPHLPQYLSCGHLYCYYCLNSNILSDNNQFHCMICDQVANLQ